MPWLSFSFPFVTSVFSMRFLPSPHPEKTKLPNYKIGVVGTGFIVEECHLLAYQKAGLEVCGLVGRNLEKTRRIAEKYLIPWVGSNVLDLLEETKPSILDIAVPPLIQPAVIETAVGSNHLEGILAQKPLALSFVEAERLVNLCGQSGKVLAVNQNMRFDPSVYALKQLIDRGILGEPVLATIEMRAVPHWMEWAKGMRSLSTWIMSIHHLDTFRFWLGTPDRVFASFRQDPRTKFDHRDGISLYILEYDGGARASGWDDVWAGPVKEGCAPSSEIRWRFEGTRGIAKGTIGWPDWPKHTPSVLEYTCLDFPGEWIRPAWDATWFPDAFQYPMMDLMNAIETNRNPISGGRENLETIALLEAIYESGTTQKIAFPKEWLKKSARNSESYK